MTSRRSSRFSGVLERMGLHRPELRAWAMYDWANSAVVTITIAALFPIYFYRVAGAELEEGVATQRFAIGTTVAMVGVALLAPLLAAMADYLPVKKKMLAVFVAIGVPAAAGLFFVQTGDWLPALVLFVIVQIAVTATFIFYDSLLPHIAGPDELDRVSTSGYALGYLGGGALLALSLVWIYFPQWFGFPHGEELSEAHQTLPYRAAFLAAAIWWLVFSLPLLVQVAEPSAPGQRVRGTSEALRRSFSQLRETIITLREYPQAVRLLIAYLIYNEGVGTIIRLAAIYGTDLGIGEGAIMGSFVLVQFVGIPCTVAFGALAGRMGTRRSIFLGLTVYLGISIFAFFLQTAWHFVTLALLVGMVQGGTQGLSRSLFASLMPKRLSTEYFAIFGVSEKLAGVLGPGLFALVITLTGSPRYAILSVVVFFIVGGLLLWRVDVEQGRRTAKEAG